MTLTLITASLATVAVESMLYGVFLVLAASSMYLHLGRIASQQSNSFGSGSVWAYFTPVILGSLCVILTVTGHWILTVTRLFDAFVNFLDGQEPLLYYSDLSLTTEVVKTAFLIATLIISDILFSPVAPFLGSAELYSVAGPGVVYELTQLGTSTVFVARLSRWISADYAFTGVFFYLHEARITASLGAGSSRLRAHITPIFLGAVVVSCTTTVHWILTVTRLFDAFISYMGGAVPLLFYANLSEPSEVVKTAVLIATLITSDVLFVYRLWMVWGYNYYVIIIPSMAVLGLCVSGVGIVYTLSQLSVGNTIFVSKAAQWIAADYSFTFACVLFSVYGDTSLQSGNTYGGGNLMRVLATIVESAAIYTAWVVAFFISYEVTSNLQYTFVDTLCQVAGVAYMMINVRVSLGWAQTAHQSQGTSSAGGIASRRGPVDHSYVMRPVAVDITRVVQKEDDMGQPVKPRVSSDYNV
ncbi:predicted protein [Postia placenta Mad-698-R]|nr:predicted protein [Postia placenta Mad-698-R]